MYKIYFDVDIQDWVQYGCCSVGIGCLDCKKFLIDVIVEEQCLLYEWVWEYEGNLDFVYFILQEGCEQVWDVVCDIFEEVRVVMGLYYC